MINYNEFKDCNLSELFMDESLDVKNYDDPNMSDWIISVDIFQKISILNTPNIHPGFLDGDDNYTIGFPDEIEDFRKPGVYKAKVKGIFSKASSRDETFWDIQFKILSTQMVYCDGSLYASGSIENLV